MGRSARNVALLVCLVVLAGCNGLPGSDTATEPSAESVTPDRTTTVGATQQSAVEPTTAENEAVTTTARNRPLQQVDDGNERTTATTEADGHSATGQWKTEQNGDGSKTSTVGQSDGDGNDGAVGR